MGAVNDNNGVFVTDIEVETRIPPARMFKALVLDFVTPLHMIAPRAIQNVEFIEGDGRPGSILGIAFEEGNQVQYVKLKIEAIDEKGFSVNYSLIEGDALVVNNLVKISYDIKFIAAPDGGSICRITSSRHYTTGDIYIMEDVKAEKKWFRGLFKEVKDYLVANRDAYKMKMY